MSSSHPNPPVPSTPTSLDAAQVPQINSAARHAAASYNEIPYPSLPITSSHPDRLYTIGRIFSMQPAETARCRVLEIGSAGGGNLIPMADQLPDAEFVGIDYAEVQVQEAQSLIDRAGLTNIKVMTADVSQLDPSTLGEFDYIICHGVYSWVPAQVQDAILDVCAKCLRPRGIAFISYNTYPGWHFRGMIRDMMQYHARKFTDTKVQIRESRALLQFLAENVDENTAYGKLLKTELGTLSQRSDSYLFHEHLETHNRPIYFHQFAEHVKQFKLKYLGDANVRSMWLGNFQGSVAKTIQRIAPDQVSQEQYTDFLQNRTFRQSLLCHEAISPNWNLTPEKLADARFMGRFKPAVEGHTPNLSAGVHEKFIDQVTQLEVDTNLAIVKASLLELSRVYPKSLSLDELLGTAMEMVTVSADRRPESSAVYRKRLADTLVTLFANGVVDVKFAADYFITENHECPKVSKLAREQAKLGPLLTNRRHTVIELEGPMRDVAVLLDGTRHRDALIDGLLTSLAGATIHRGEMNEALATAPDRAREQLLRVYPEILQELAVNALLVD